jgi:dihydroorotate dehydrogenase (fumarate)
MGLDLDNPIMVGSSGLTQSVDGVRRCADAGAGAVVLKSVFEEQIQADVDGLVRAGESQSWHPEAEEYISRYGREDAVRAYLELIRGAKRAVSVPVIASIHCASTGGWVEFARRVEEAGADGLELNVFVLPADPRRDGAANEQVYFDVVREVKSRVSIPVALKIGYYFSGLSRTVVKLSHAGPSGLVLFNRFFRIDFDIETLTLVPANVFSHADETVVPLRWISILSGQVGCDLAASTGIRDGAAVVKHLLAGAAAVQVCSVLYDKEVEHLGSIIEELRAWMQRHDFSSIHQFRGRLSSHRSDNPAAYERVQFMRATAGID